MAESSPTYEIDLTALAFGGDSLGRLPDGRAVFVPFGLPGERVRIRLVEEKRAYARGELLEVLEPSSRRIAARCPHFGECGGCHYQNLAYEDQLDAKTEILRDVLARVGGLSSPPIRPIVPAPQPWNYRNHVQFHLSAEGRLGYQAQNSHRVVPIRECHLPEGALNEVWPRLEVEPLPGLERVSLRLGQEEGVQLILESSDPQPPEFSVDFPLSAVHLSPAGSMVLAGDEQVYLSVRDRTFCVSPGSFFQVNTLQAEAMVAHLLELLPLTSTATVIDVYCGVGLFSAFIAPRVGRLMGVELSQAACEDFAANLDEFDNVELYQGAAEDVLPALQVRADGMVVDPPRSGLDPRALDAIAAMQPPVLVYVSCDPSTLARDAKRLLAKGYTLEQVTPFDLFPQTYHIESISLFKTKTWGKKD
ncbi:MAG: class I SAM-dependent RNA methyltransferase [Chloroflexi bacterium]|nr:class I SAM-dependent RNA methyltransferase [Chloroflexota bacterium]